MGFGTLCCNTPLERRRIPVLGILVRISSSRRRATPVRSTTTAAAISAATSKSAHASAAITATSRPAHLLFLNLHGACFTVEFFPSLLLLVALDLGGDFLLMRLHFCNGTDLSQRDVFSVSQGDDLVKHGDELECPVENFLFVDRAAIFGEGTGKEMERVNVLQDVGGLVGDEDHVEFFHGLIDVSDRLGFCWFFLRMLEDGVIGVKESPMRTEIRVLLLKRQSSHATCEFRVGPPQFSREVSPGPRFQ